MEITNKQMTIKIIFFNNLLTTIYFTIHQKWHFKVIFKLQIAWNVNLKSWHLNKKNRNKASVLWHWKQVNEAKN